MSDTVSVRKGDLDILVDACTSYFPGEVPGDVHNAFARMLTAFDEAHADDEDAPGSEPEPAKVIVVTEMPFGDGAPAQKRYDANQTDTSPYGQLRLLRKGTEVAVYQSSAWLSVRDEDALVPEDFATVRALGIARRALTDILKRSEDYDQPFGRPEIGDAARDALEEIFTETEL